MPAVTIYTTSYCPYCMSAKSLLTKKGASFEEIDIGRSNEARETMLKKAKGRHTVPQIFIGDLHVGGCDDLYDLDSKGQLDRLLQNEAT